MRLERTQGIPPRSDSIQNMSCRPITTVHSEGLDHTELPERLKGKSILINPWEYIPNCLKRYARGNPEMSVPVFNAILTLGNTRYFTTYDRFIKNKPGHEQSIMNWVSRMPENISQLPRVGHIRGIESNDFKVDFRKKSTLSSNLHSVLYIMARSNRYVYIRDKSPLLSLISVNRKIQIIFVNQGGQES